MDKKGSSGPSINLPEKECNQRSRLPSASVKPMFASNLPMRSRLPTIRSTSSYLSDSSNTPARISHTNISQTEATSRHVEEENQNPSTSSTERVISGSSLKKRKTPGASSANLQPTKKAKPDLNPRIDYLKTNQRKMARRSINNALKFSRNSAAASKTSTTRPASSTTKFSSRPAVTSSYKQTTKSKTVSSMPPTKAVPAIKSGASSANSSRNSSGSSNGEIKTKRKPWDLKGQVQDLKEALAKEKKKNASKQASAIEKEAMIDSILQRLDLLESEKQTYHVEKRRLSTGMADLQAKLKESESKILKLEENERAFALEKQTLFEQNRTWEKKYVSLKVELEHVTRDLAESRKQFEESSVESAALKATLDERNKEISHLHSSLENLTAENKQQEEDRKRLLNVVQELKGNIRVFCRVRPMLEKEKEEFGEMKHIQFVGNDDKSIVIINDSNTPATYTFDKVFCPQATQLDVFNEVYQLTESVLDGYNVCVFAYGQTGAGKTYTMEGPSHINTDEDGIIPRVMKLMFEKSEEKKKFGWEYSFAVQYVEIYQETLQDLLQTDNDVNIKLEIKTVTQGGKQKIWVKNLSEHKVDNIKQVQNLFQISKKKRKTASTSANERSSRSHSVFILKVNGRNENNGDLVESCMNLIDLAGSERVAETGSSGVRLKEAQKINSSLTELTNVIMALANKESHVPYRNSKLTFMLKDSLGGNSKTLMLVNVNPTKRATSETINTLRFATKVNKCHIGTAQKVVKFN